MPNPQGLMMGDEEREATIRPAPLWYDGLMYSIHHVAISVTDRNSSAAFYKLLEFDQIHFWQADDKSLSITHLRNGEFILELFCYAHPQSAPGTIHATSTDLPV